MFYVYSVKCDFVVQISAINIDKRNIFKSHRKYGAKYESFITYPILTLYFFLTGTIKTNHWNVVSNFIFTYLKQLWLKESPSSFKYVNDWNIISNPHL